MKIDIIQVVYIVKFNVKIFKLVAEWGLGSILFEWGRLSHHSQCLVRSLETFKEFIGPVGFQIDQNICMLLSHTPGLASLDLGVDVR